MARPLLAEFIGTFALVFAGCGAIAVDAQTGALGHPGVAVTFGLVIAVMIYGLGHISGAHFNPAVSVGFAIGRHFPWPRVAGYAAAQVAGAIVAAALLRATLGDGADLGVTMPSGSVAQAFSWEVVFSAFLMLVITAVATDTRAVGVVSGLAIGGMIALAAMVGGPISGASLNPARSIGPALVTGQLTDLWLYLTAPVIGAVIGAVVYRFLREPWAEAGAD